MIILNEPTTLGELQPEFLENSMYLVCVAVSASNPWWMTYFKNGFSNGSYSALIEDGDELITEWQDIKVCAYELLLKDQEEVPSEIKARHGFTPGV